MTLRRSVAANDQEDEQITRADHGSILAEAQSVSANTAGSFSAPLALNVK